MMNSLMARIVMVVTISGVVCLGGLVVFLGAFATAPTSIKLIVMAGMLVVLPLFIGWLTSRLVTDPLQRFHRVVVALQASNYKAEVETVGIAEFDRIALSFNELTKRLRQEEKLRKDLISDASHELNTPLSALVGQLTAMQEGKLPLSKQRVGTVKEQADRLVALVQSLDAYTRARAVSTEAPEPIELKELCRMLLEEWVPEIERQRIAVELDMADDLVIHASPQAVRRILSNLLQNAVRYSGASQLVIKADDSKMVVADNGRGVPAEVRPYLFERFYRVETSRSRDTGGLGLGLAIVKELAEAQGWIVALEDAEPGLQCVITFRA